MLLAAACSGQEQQQSEPDPGEAISVAAPEAKPPAAEYIGVVTSKTSMVIAAEVEGPIKSINVDQSREVKKGDLVAEIDTTELETKLEEQKANKLAAQGEAGGAGARCAEARLEAANEARLARRGAVAPASVRAKEAEAAAACGQAGGGAGRAKAAEVEIQRIQKQIKNAKVLAPMDGTISTVKQKVGAREQIGQPIAQVVDPNDLLVRFAVPRAQRNKFAKGTQIRFDAKDTPDARPHYATVTFIRDEIDPKIDFAIVDAELDEKNHRELKVSMRGHVHIVADNNAPAGGTL